MRKKTLLFLMAVLLSLPARLSAFEYTYEGVTLNYEVINEEAKTCKVSGYKDFSGALVIPDVANDGTTDYTVTSIGKNAFFESKGLTSVVIPNSVTSIGAYAFYVCRGLTSVVIGNSVETIGEGAFYCCTGLTSVVIPNSVQKIDKIAFGGCDLKKSAFPNTLKNPFENGWGTVIAYNPEGAIIEDGWIWGPNKSAIYFVPLSLEGEYTIPESVTSIGNGAFAYCSDLTSVVIPNLVTSIGDYSFYNCNGLTSVVIPNSVTSIGEMAFNKCSGLKKSAYPNTLSNPFSDGVAVAYTSEGAIIEDGWIWGPNKSAIYFAPLSFEGEYSIPESVASIGKNAFYGCSGLTSVVIPNSVQTIGAYAFYKCSGLTSVVIPNLVTSIGKYAFYGCTGLTSVVISNSVTSIGEMAFNKCSGLKKSAYPNTLENPFPYGICVAYNPEGAIIEDGWVWGPNKEAIYFVPLTLEGEFSIPESVTSIGGNAFEGCSGLTSVTALPESPAVMNVNSFEGLYDKVKLTVPDVAVNNYLATNWSLFKNIQNNSGLELGTFSDGVFEYRLNPTDMTAMVIGAKDYSTLQIPERFTDDTDGTNPVRYYIKGIGYKAFDGKGVNSVEFNSRTQMEYIGDYAFANTKISSITLPETMKNIGDYAFYKASNLSEVELKEGVSAIGSHAFAETNLSSISIPESVATIGDYAFYKTSNLSEVELKEGVSAIGSHAFAETNLSSISIPESVATIGDYAFYNTKNLSKVELKDGLFSIGENAFGANGKRSGRESFYMPSTVETVGLNAFNGFTCIHVDISDLNAWCRIDFGNETANPLGGSEGLYIDGDEVTKLDIPENIREIKPYAFAGFNSMESLVISNGVELLGDYSFANCLNLREITVGNNVQLIGLTVFDKCFNVNSLVLSDAKSSIEIHDSSILTWLNNVTYLYMGRKINITR